MKTYNLTQQNIDNIEAEIAFLSAHNEYKIDYIPEYLKQVIIFVPYFVGTNIVKGNAKALAQYFQNQNVITIDTKYTHQTAKNCNLNYNEVCGTLVLAVDYILNNGYDLVEIEGITCNPKEMTYLKTLESQKRVKLISAAEKNVQSVVL